MNEVGTFKDRMAQGFILLILLQVYMNDQMNRRLYSVFRLITSQVQRAFQLRIPFPFGVRLLFELFDREHAFGLRGALHTYGRH